jgi:hypothetical protein
MGEADGAVPGVLLALVPNCPSEAALDRFRRFRRPVWSPFFCCRSRSRPSGGVFLQCCPLHRRDASPPVAPDRTKMGRMSNRSSNRRELRVLGSFRNSAHREEAVGSFRKSVASALRLQSWAYEISEIDLAKTINECEQVLAHRRAS